MSFTEHAPDGRASVTTSEERVLLPVFYFRYAVAVRLAVFVLDSFQSPRLINDH